MDILDNSAKLRVLECFVFFSFFRLKVIVYGNIGPISVYFLYGGKQVPCQIETSSQQSGETQIICEGQIVRAEFPSAYALEVRISNASAILPCTDLVQHERIDHAFSLWPSFRRAISDWQHRNPDRRARILDVGGRYRSGFSLRNHLSDCDFSVLDIAQGDDVDHVCDAHEMSRSFRHAEFDFICSVSTFEHLLMPWKVVLEINKILKLGGCAFIQTHQTAGLHDLPGDYFRFSDQAWKGLFNPDTGFEIVDTAMTDFVRMVPMHFFTVEEGYENAGGFYGSAVFVRKIGESKLAWPVNAASALSASPSGPRLHE